MVETAAALAMNPRYRRFALVAVLLAAVVGVGVATLAGQPADPRERLDRARDLVFAKKPEAALREVRRALAELGEDGDKDLREKALARAAQITDLHLSDAHLNEALGYYRQLFTEFRESPAAFDAGLRMGEILRQRLHDDVHAEQQYVAVVDAFPAQPGVERLLVRAAAIALENHRYEATRTSAQRVLDRYPDSELGADAQDLVAQSYHLEGKLTEATGAYELLAERWPRTPAAARALFEAGNCLAAQSDYGHAIARYIEALPEHPDPMQVQKSLERARKHFSAFRAMAPGSKAYAFAKAPGR
jgi:tetratricopeptide (TPR) repeat protein